MPKNEPKNTTEGRYERVGPREFIDIFSWVLKLFFKLQPIQGTIFLVSHVLNQSQSILYTYIFAKILDKLIETIQRPNASVEMLYPYLGILLIFLTCQTILSYILSVSARRVRTRGHPLFRRYLYTKIRELGIQNLESPEVNNKIHRSEMWVNQFVEYVRDSVTLISYIVQAAVSLAIIGSILPIFSLVVVILVIPYGIYDRKMRQKYYKFDYENTEGRRKSWWSASFLVDPSRLTEIIITKAYRFLDDKFVTFQNWYNDTRLKIQQKWILGGHVLLFIRSDLMSILGYILIFKKFLAKVLTIGETAFWMRTIDVLGNSLQNTVRGINNLQEFSIQIKDTYLLLNTKPAFEDGTVELPKLKIGPSIKLKDVKFKYPRTDKHVLDGINLEIKPGEEIAIVGPNGAGKTTLVKLICRLYQASEGEILINDINVNGLKIDTLYQNTSVLFQDFNTYPHLTVKENIYIGDTGKPEDKKALETAIQTADAMEFVQEFPNKFDQVLSERFKGGIRPSTGQHQKIAIARFFYRDTPLVIFDEPTASIDAISEYKIFSKIYEFFERKTVILISHRYSTVRNANRIIVLDKGQIIEEGTHEQLMKLNGKYAEGFRLQAEGYTT